MNFITNKPILLAHFFPKFYKRLSESSLTQLSQTSALGEISEHLTPPSFPAYLPCLGLLPMENGSRGPPTSHSNVELDTVKACAWCPGLPEAIIH